MHIISFTFDADGTARLDLSPEAGEYGKRIAARLHEAAHLAGVAGSMLEYSCRKGAYLEFRDQRGHRIGTPYPVQVLGLIAPAGGAEYKLCAALKPGGEDILPPVSGEEHFGRRRTAY